MQPTKLRTSWPSPKIRKIWRIVRPIVVLLCSIAIAYSVFSVAINFVLDRYINPVDINDAAPIIFEVKENESASEVANKLYSAGGKDQPGLIVNKAVFKVYVDFVGKANKLKAGTYFLSRNMDIGQIVDIICEGNPPKETTKFKVQEGYTVSGVLWSLGEAGLTIDEDTFLALCNNRETFNKYPFISQIPLALSSDKQRDYLLEGYLFPDTYEVFVDVQPETIINKMLVRFNAIFTDKYIDRAQELGMSIDQVVTLASIIEREARLAEDFPKVSAVFHNRLQKEMKLESCATMQYVLKTNKFVYTSEELATISPYNTYLNAGLPVGPISNPGELAIEAALYPNEAYREKEYLFFCNANPKETSELVFARTLNEHQENIQQYSKYWDN